MILQNEFKIYFNQWPWEWFLSLNLERGEADSLIRRYARELGLSEKLQIACQGVASFIPQRHIHLMALGRNRHGKTLIDCNVHDAERLWGRLTKKSAFIKPVYDSGAVGYIVDQNMPKERYEMVMPYNKKLLEKCKIRTRLPSAPSALFSKGTASPLTFIKGVSACWEIV